ncbi:NgoFVII family restriction endonuclease, partial [Xanthomonas citri pv. citri]|nr:NgoFVII family restriction endonuclease [Xanthomonas citri pv. citri]
EDLFASENLALKAGKSESKLTLKAYDRPLDVQQLKLLKD